MTELINDPCIPSVLVIPTQEGDSTTQPDMSGAIIVSGGKLYFQANSGLEKITSVAI